MKRERLFFLAAGINLLMLALGLFLKGLHLLTPIAIWFCCVWLGIVGIGLCVKFGFRYAVGLFGLVAVVAWLGDRSARHSHEMAFLIFLGLLALAFVVWDLPRIIRGWRRKK